MEAQITDIATTAGRVLLDPTVLGASAVGTLVFVTGAAGRLVEILEFRSAGKSG